MSIALDATSSGQGIDVSSFSFSHTCSGSNRILIVALRMGHGYDRISSVTYNGVSLSKLGSVSGGSFLQGYMYYLMNPDTGSHTVSVTSNQVCKGWATAVSYTGVAGMDNVVTDGGLDGTSASLNISGVGAGDWSVGFTSVMNTVVSISEGAGQNLRKENSGMHQSDDNDSTLSWTFSGEMDYASVGGRLEEYFTGSAPSAPSGLGATQVSSSEIDLVWTDNSDDETGFKIERKESGGSYSQIDTVGSNVTSYSDSGLDSGTTYYYKIRAHNAYGNSAYSNEDSATTYSDISDSTSDTVSVSESTSDSGEFSDSTSDTVTITDSASGAKMSPLELNFNYLFGDFSGKIYKESDDIYLDNDTDIDCYYITNQTDFADQYQEMLGRWATLYKVKVWYTDLDADTPITCAVSTDGGSTWTERGASVGTGAEIDKAQDFYFTMTGHHFVFKVESETSDKRFQLVNLVAYFLPRGDHFSVN